MAHLFISYSKKDIEFARYLKLRLEAAGFAVWIDERGIEPSDDWWATIERSIQTCAALLVVMSEHARDSRWVRREVLLAEDSGKPLFPVLLSGKPWSQLADIQYHDMRDGLRAALSPRFVARLRAAAGERAVLFSIQQGDVTQFPADLLVMKYAQSFYGADATVANLLGLLNVMPQSTTPVDTSSTLAPKTRDDPAVWSAAQRMSVRIGEHRTFDSDGRLSARQVTFVGTPRLRQMGYAGVRAFAELALRAAQQDAPGAQHLAMTMHGAGFGLDEQEALVSQLGGLLDALSVGAMPPALQHISLVELREERAGRLSSYVDEYLNKQGLAHLRDAGGAGWWLPVGTPTPDDEGNAAPVVVLPPAESKPYAYVSLSPDMEDLYYYAIQPAVHASELLCVRIERGEADRLRDEPLADEQAPGDWLEEIKARIDAAAVVIVELSGSLPGVLLELGYAWGKGRPTIVLTRHGHALPFSAESQRCVRYATIREAESGLRKMLKGTMQ